MSVLSVAAVLLLAASSSARVEEAEVDQSVRAVADQVVFEQDALKEPMRRWYSASKLKPITPPGRRRPPLYARVTLEAKTPGPATVGLCVEPRGTYIDASPIWILDSETVAPFKDRLRGKRRAEPFFPGEQSDWIDVSEVFHYGYREILVAELRGEDGAKNKKLAEKGGFRIDFSRSQDGGKVLGSIASHGGDKGVAMASLAKGYVTDDVAMSVADLEKAKAAGKGPACRLKKFPVHLCNVLNKSDCSPAALANELEVFRHLGVSDPGGTLADAYDPQHDGEPLYLPRGDFLSRCRLGCICSPDYVALTNGLKKLAVQYAGPLSRGRRLYVCIADEPYYALSSLTNCQSCVKTCRERFGRDFTLEPSSDVKAHLETIAYRDKVVADFYRTVQEVASSIHSNLLVTANFGTSLVFGGNLSAPGTSPFVLADAGGLGFGLTEDWSNCQYTRQFCSYMCDVYRAAMERNGRAFGMMSILTSPPEITAKAFSEVGHGAAALSLFCYGPHWLSGDNCNLNAAHYPAIRRFCETTAAIEDVLVGSRVAKGDAALLLSESTDRLEIVAGAGRNWTERNPYGKERMSLSLLLDHCGVRTDILDEKGLMTRLSEYKVLFATDRRVRRECAKVLSAWLKKGGVLVKMPDALVADEFDRPLGDELKVPAGRQRLIPFSPWKDYVKVAKQVGACYSHREFPSAVRDAARALACAAGVERRIVTDCPLVEASILEKGAVRIVVLSNWSPERDCQTLVTLSDVKPFVRATSASGKSVNVRRTGAGVELSVRVDAGDYLVLE